MRARITLLLVFFCAVVHVTGYEQRRARTNGQKAQRDVKRNGSATKGRFSLLDGARCSWVVERAVDVFVLGLSCKNGADSFSCEYQSNLSTCPQHASNPKAYWKLVARVLRNQSRLCRDAKVVVRAAGCRVHFRLKEEERKTPRVLLPESKLCSERLERLRAAENFCKSSWSSVCTFLFLMIESDECA